MNTAPADTEQGVAVAVPQETLDRWRAACHTAQQEALSAASLALKADRWRETRARANAAAEAVRVMGVQLDQAGANRPADMPKVRPMPAALRDTEAVRRYLSGLRIALNAALEMDEERGDEDGPEVQMVELLIRDAEQGPAAAQWDGRP